MTEWNAPEYAKLSSLQAAMAAEVLSLLRPRLRGDERILDVGCGNGKITREIAAMVPRGSVVGVDASAKMIEFASGGDASATGPVGAANLSFQVVDARQLAFREEFDLVVSFNALHWVAESEQSLVLRGICAALKPGATAQLRLVSRGPRKSLENVIEETATSATWNEYFVGHRDPYLHMAPEDYAALAERCGFQVERVEMHDHSWDFGTPAGFAAFGAVTFVEWSQHVPEAERPNFIADALARYREVVGDDRTFRFYQMDISLRRE